MKANSNTGIFVFKVICYRSTKPLCKQTIPRYLRFQLKNPQLNFHLKFQLSLTTQKTLLDWESTYSQICFDSIYKENEISKTLLKRNKSSDFKLHSQADKISFQGTAVALLVLLAQKALPKSRHHLSMNQVLIKPRSIKMQVIFMAGFCSHGNRRTNFLSSIIFNTGHKAVPYLPRMDTFVIEVKMNGY